MDFPIVFLDELVADFGVTLQFTSSYVNGPSPMIWFIGCLPRRSDERRL